MNVKHVWSTPNIDHTVAYIARVSNPSNQNNATIKKLLRYMMENGHVSPFEMVNVCLEINTTRDIARQILRHRSFSFQEFSQRYANVRNLYEAPLKECRLQDEKNRQNSIPANNAELKIWWDRAQRQHITRSTSLYDMALLKGIAKEQARAVLPEGLTMSRIYMNGNMRNWIFYLKQRLDPSTQKEHRILAEEILSNLRSIAPITVNSFFSTGLISDDI